MKIGLHVARFNWPGGSAVIGPRLAEIVRTADEAGFATFWPMDHFFQIGTFGEADEPMLEGYATLAFAAGITRQIELGLLVTGVTYRHPGVLIKTVTTLDVLSGGRAILGIGAAWNEREHRGLGVPFPPLAERFERLEETLQIAHQMWSGQTAPYQGEHYHLAEPLNAPAPVRRPRPPILVGGGGEKKTLRLVARYADACNLFETPALGRKLAVLRERCDEIGRPYDEIEKTCLTNIVLSRDGGNGTLTPAQAIEKLGQLAELGIDQVIINQTAKDDLRQVAWIGEAIIPAVAHFGRQLTMSRE